MDLLSDKYLNFMTQAPMCVFQWRIVVERAGKNSLAPWYGLPSIHSGQS